MTAKPKVKSSTVVYNGFFDVKKDVLEKHDGQTGFYTSLVMPTPAAIVLAQDTEGRWILNKEYRHPTGDIVLGCCGGRLEKDEDPLVGAQRELFEETGYWSDELELLGKCYQCPAITDQVIFYYFAANASPKGAQKLDPLEFIQTCLLTELEVHQALHSNVPVDASLFTALWLWKTKLNNKSSPTEKSSTDPLKTSFSG